MSSHRRLRLLALFGFMNIAAALGCGSVLDETEAERNARVVYGRDDRIELLDSDDVHLRSIAIQSVAAVLPREYLRIQDDRTFALDAPSLREVDGLCPGVRFEEQLSAARCTAVLIDDDLVLTAGHCIASAEQCRRGLAVVFNFVSTGAGAPHLAAESVYGCADVVAYRNDTFDARPSRDFAIVQLDRVAAAPLAPITLAGVGQERSSALSVVGMSQGLPMKAQPVTLSGRPDHERGFFQIIGDLFHGDSGAPVIAESAESAGELLVVGLIVGGQEDYVNDTSEGCVRLRTGDASDPLNTELAGWASDAVADLCASGWRSDRLCKVSEPCAAQRCTVANGAACSKQCTAAGDSSVRASACTLSVRADRAVEASVRSIAWTALAAGLLFDRRRRRLRSRWTVH